MNRYLKDLEQAFRNIDVKYFESLAYSSKGDKRQRPENSFTRQLATEFEILIRQDSEIFKKFYQHLMIDTDLPKERIKNKRPDFVLHGARNDRDYQEIFAEVKLKYRDKELIEDLKKLKTAISMKDNDLRFKNAVMIVGNEDYNKTTTIIQDFIIQISEEDLQRLHLFHWSDKKAEDNYTIKTFLEIKSD